jgi:hypothetical protein
MSMNQEIVGIVTQEEKEEILNRNYSARPLNPPQGDFFGMVPPAGEPTEGALRGE